MLGRQKQVFESLLRLQQFIGKHPPTANAAQVRLAKEFDEVIARIWRAAAHQDVGCRLGRAATIELYEAVRKLREHHLRPIAVIARAIEEYEPGIDKALRLPTRRQAVTRLIAEARSTRDAAKLHEEQMVICGRPVEFLSQLDEAIEAVLETIRRRDSAEQLQVGATAAIVQHIKRGRRLVAILESMYVAVFDADAVKAAEWRQAKRVQLKPGARREAAVEEAPAEVTPLPVRLVVAA